ncbi:hypothetical protein QN277_012238 [Acacia crassicarpa]|uniref:Uncharacterized protein n=1 Tax=Acacia crassicarpa TaxID=499986 RepID=A0AAE1TEE1_9FABA|nr:hypothetical protein QN277_012238 [Acacia crassicarpa]
MLNLLSIGTSGQGKCLIPHKYDEKQCRRVLAEFIVCAEQPFRIVEKPIFKKLLNVFEPRFPIPSRRTIGREMWQLYVGEVKVLKKFLKQSAKRVCLTTDCWTSSQNFNYMCLTAHFIDDEWNLHKRILNFVMIENHRGDTIGKAIEQSLLDWEIEKVFTLTVDNASANDSALGYLKRRLRSWKGLVCQGDYLQLRCCAHVLNLVVNEGIREMKESFEAIRNAVRYVRSSPSRFLKFKTWAESEKIDTKSLVCLDVSTRWNSTYLMLEAAMKFQKVFDRMRDEDADYISFFSSSSRRERDASSSSSRDSF